MYAYVLECTYMNHKCIGAYEGAEEGIKLTGPEVTGGLKWLLGPKLRSAPRTPSALNQRVISPGPDNPDF